MKKIVFLTLALTLVLSALVGCGGSQTGKAADLSGIKTLGDVFALDAAEYVTDGSLNDTYAYGFSIGGVYYRALATMPEDVSEKYYAVDYSQENYEEETKNLLSPLKVDRVENLSETIPSREELSKLVGKTGEDLLNDDWYGRFYDFESMECEMEHGVFVFKIIFEGKVDLPEDYDADEIIKPLVIKSVEFLSLGDITGDLE